MIDLESFMVQKMIGLESLWSVMQSYMVESMDSLNSKTFLLAFFSSFFSITECQQLYKLTVETSLCARFQLLTSAEDTMEFRTPRI